VAIGSRPGAEAGRGGERRARAGRPAGDPAEAAWDLAEMKIIATEAMTLATQWHRDALTEAQGPAAGGRGRLEGYGPSGVGLGGVAR
jgi:hypothetical protein